jgi:hypothetical protein
MFRTQVTVSAIKAAAAHLGTLGVGRKTLVIVTQSLGGPGSGRGYGLAPVASRALPQVSIGEVERMAIDIARAANDSNTAVHVIDPRGLRVDGSLSGGALDTIAFGTGGDLHRTNDAAIAFRQMLRQVSALYLLGYTRDMPTDGLFHQIKVRVKRSGVSVRAREGYWAPRTEDVEDAKRKAAAAVLPEPVAQAFASLTATGAPRMVDVWSGWRVRPDGGLLVTVAWSARDSADASAVAAAVSASLTAAGDDLGERSIEPGGTTFEAPAGPVRLALRVLNKDAEVVDRERESSPDQIRRRPISASVHRWSIGRERRRKPARCGPARSRQSTPAANFCGLIGCSSA